MARKYTREELLDKIAEERSAGIPFYRIGALNYQGTVRGGERWVPYQEAIAEWLAEEDLSELDAMLLENTPPVHAEDAAFATEGVRVHGAPQPEDIRSTNRNEENIAKRLMQLGKVGDKTEVVDYQVPINRVSHSAHGKADLVVLEDGMPLLVELKDDKSEETLLRAMAEARTYYLEVASSGHGPAGSGTCTPLDRYRSCYGRAPHFGVALFEGTRPYEDYVAARSGTMPALGKLARRWDVCFYLVSRVDGGGDDVHVRDREYAMLRINV